MDAEELKSAVERRVGVSPDDINESMLRKAGLQVRVFLLPENFNERARYMADVLVQMLGIGSSIKGDLRLVSGTLCQALSYLVNSASWREGELQNYDLDEIRRKVGRLGSSR